MKVMAWRRLLDSRFAMVSDAGIAQRRRQLLDRVLVLVSESVTPHTRFHQQTRQPVHHDRGDRMKPRDTG